MLRLKQLIRNLILVSQDAHRAYAKRHLKHLLGS
jgi:hypothetical protein